MQSSEAAKEYATRLSELAARLQLPENFHDDFGWTQEQVGKINHLFHHASRTGEAVVTFLDLTRTRRK